jgi:uncharacterized protein YacL
MAIRQFFVFLDAAVGYIHPDPEAVEQTTNTSELLYHRKIVLAAAILGALAAVAGTIFAVVEITGGKENGIKALILFPIVFGVIGVIIGSAVACLVAPQAFLTGPVGQKWMKLIGTNSVTTARVVCAALIIAIVGLLPGLAVYAAFLKKH